MKMFINHGIHRIHGTLVSVVLLFGVAVSAVAAEPGITVEARQRYPWNGLVDLKFTITGESGTKYDTSFVAKDMVGGTNIAMKTIRKSNGVAAEEKEKLLPGTYNWIWDAAADLPDGFKCDRMTVTGTAEQSQGLYMVIDLSSGANSSKYPVSYLDAVPTGGWSDEYKTTKLVLRRIEAGSFKMGGVYDVTISQRFCIGIFEVTQKQWELIVGRNPVTADKSIGDQRPVQEIFWNTIRGNSNLYNWPSVVTVDPNSFIGRLRKRTSLDFDLPTEAQWEYACRAGTTSKYNNGGNAESDLKLVGWYRDNVILARAENVGSLRPNNWGLYDMHGNQSEFCLDWMGSLIAGTDPKGPNSDTSSYVPMRVVRGGSWSYDASGCTSSYREGKRPSTTDGYITYGFRICLTLSASK
jgi:formylglycine-generating enzyme required for sulfatase activity